MATRAALAFGLVASLFAARTAAADGLVPAPEWVRCGVEADTLRCQAPAPGVIAPTIVVVAIDKNGTEIGVGAPANGGDAVSVAAIPADAYPIKVRVHAMLPSGAVRGLTVISMVAFFDLGAPSSFSVKQPFDLWQLTVRGGGQSCVFNAAWAEQSIAPFAPGYPGSVDGSPTTSVGGSFFVRDGETTTVLVPAPASGALQGEAQFVAADGAHVKVPVAIAAPGRYVAAGNALTAE